MLSAIAFTTIVFHSEPLRNFIAKNGLIAVLCILIVFVVEYMIFCYPDTYARKLPINYIMISIFTLAESYIIGVICLDKTPETVMIAGGLTLALFLLLTLYAWINHMILQCVGLL